jgi:hypothetical protein
MVMENNTQSIDPNHCGWRAKLAVALAQPPRKGEPVIGKPQLRFTGDPRRHQIERT